MITKKTEKPTRSVADLEPTRCGSNIVYLGNGQYRGSRGSFIGRKPMPERAFGISQN